MLRALHTRCPTHAVALFFGTEVRAKHSETISRVFERLLEKIRECDPDGMIEEAVRGSDHGRLYDFIQEARAAQSA